MSTQRKRQCTLITDRYVRQNAEKWDLDIPSDIVLIIFMFYYIKMFEIEYGNKIIREDNTITNIIDSYRNTSLIGDWMDPGADNNCIHTFKVKIVKNTGVIGIGIVKPGYNMEEAIIYLKGYAYFNDGHYYKNGLGSGKADDYSTGCIVSLTLNLNALSLSYDIIDKENVVESKKGVLYKSGKIDTCKYKWAVSIYQQHDCVEIIDVYSNN